MDLWAAESCLMILKILSATVAIASLGFSMVYEQILHLLDRTVFPMLSENYNDLQNIWQYELLTVGEISIAHRDS